MIAAAGNEAVNGHNAQANAAAEAAIGMLPGGPPGLVPGVAAGGPAGSPGARFPAAFGTVLGVGALPPLKNEPHSHRVNPGVPTPRASYSNKADAPPVKGVVTLGGEPGQEGIIGIYLGEDADTPNFEPGWG